MDNSKIESALIDKKFDHYRNNENDFVIPTEITVTITLAEYRTLVNHDATRQLAIDAAEKDKYTRETEIKTVKEENARLKSELYDLKTKIDELNEQLKAPDPDCAGRSVTYA